MRTCVGARGVALALLVALGGCASLVEERGFEAVRGLAPEPLKADVRRLRTEEDAKAAAAVVETLL